MDNRSAPAPAPAPSCFDAYARDYARLHARSVEVTGEDPVYFAAYKRRCIERLVGPDFDEPVLDYGCGTGSLLAQLRQRFTRLGAYDPSTESLLVAREHAPDATFHAAPTDIPDGRYGLAVLACVLHHVPPRERPAVMARVRAALRPGGRLVIFEHNPLNPLTLRAVAACPFDEDAVLLHARECRALLREGGFDDLRLDHIVFLPHALRALRWLEPSLRWLPIGAQMMAVGTKR